jgi:hypothetical protein
MNTCEECGLPQKICSALKLYRKAFKSYEDGDHAGAHNWADGAAALIAEYKAERPKPLRPYVLSDEDRLRLSQLF